MPLEDAYGVAHLEVSDLLVDGREGSGVHGVPLGDGSDVVCHDVPQSEAETFIVLGDVENRSYVSAGHGNRLWVLAPDCSVYHRSVVHVGLELTDERLGGCCCSGGHSDDEL